MSDGNHGGVDSETVVTGKVGTIEICGKTCDSQNPRLIAVEDGGFRLEYRRGNGGSREKATSVASIANNTVV